MRRRVTTGEVLIGRLQRGEDLLEALTVLCRREGVRLGKLEAIGAVEKARLGFYDQQERVYSYFDLDQPMEILALLGNVSLRDGEAMVHAHLTLGDRQGRSFGGHLAPGTTVFACEYVVQILEGGELNRGADEATGLPLWES